MFLGGERHFFCSVLQVDVRVVTTDHATHFYDINEVPVRVYTDKDEWEVSTAFEEEAMHFHYSKNNVILFPAVTLHQQPDWLLIRKFFIEDMKGFLYISMLDVDNAL